jgi:hypothetical protein
MQIANTQKQYLPNAEENGLSKKHWYINQALGL